MNESYHILFSIAFTLFLLMDPVGNVPIYLSVLKDIPPKRQQVIIVRELMIALGVIILFAFLGESLFNLLHVGQETAKIAGGIILFLMALRMIFPNGKSIIDLSNQGEPFIVPLAIPLVAGPSILAAVMIYAQNQPYVLLTGAICIAWLMSTLILLAAPLLKKVLKNRGIVACERLMGLILILVAIQMFLEGITKHLCP